MEKTTSFAIRSAGSLRVASHRSQEYQSAQSSPFPPTTGWPKRDGFRMTISGIFEKTRLNMSIPKPNWARWEPGNRK